MDLDAVQERHDLAFKRVLTSETGETLAEFRERVDSEYNSAAWDSAEDVPALLAEIRRLQVFDVDGPVEEDAEVFDRVEAPSDMPMLGVRWTDSYQMLSWGELLTLAEFYGGRLVDVTGSEAGS
jgi:hypothetical protein